MKKVIGVMPLWDDEKESYWMLPAYLNGLEKSGLIPVVLPPRIKAEDFDGFMQKFDGFLFTGGQDVSPKLYGEEILPVCGEINEDRDILEKNVFDYCVKNDVPLLGICRGIQVINVMSGGTLYQDINSQYKTNIDHHMKKPYSGVCHHVSIKENTPLANVLKAGDLAVNSVHHQAIKNVGKNLEVMAISEDGLVEGVYVPDKKFIWGIQWHPEYSFEVDENSRKIFAAFKKAVE